MQSTQNASQIGVIRLAFPVASLHGVLLIVQPILAGMILSGSEIDALDLHAWNARVIFIAAVALLAITIQGWRRGIYRWVCPLTAGLLIVAEGLQFHFGYTANLLFHVPLGVVIAVASCILAFALSGLSFAAQPKQG